MNKEELKEMGRELKELLEKYPNRQKEILFYIFGEDTIREIIGKPTYEELEQKVNQLELDVDSYKNKYENANRLYLDTSKKLKQLETNIDEVIEILNQPMLNYASCVKALDEIEEILERGKE